MTEPNIYEKAEHEYSQLHGENSIRLLRLLPGEHSDEIHCQLMAVSLSDNPEYEALSYVWGDASELFEISCEGRCLKITRSECSSTIGENSSSVDTEEVMNTNLTKAYTLPYGI
jgi:hypothetical protein